MATLGVPPEVDAVFREFRTCEFTTLAKDNTPITWPTVALYQPTTASFVITTQGSGVLSIWLIGVVGADSVEQARTSGIMRFSQPHDPGGSPCLPSHHPRSHPA
jgi:hypothetical protein